MLTNKFDIVINFGNIVIADLEVEISHVGMTVTVRGSEKAIPGVEIVTDLIATVIDVMADFGKVTGSETVTGQIGPVTLTGEETGSVTEATSSVTLSTGERGTALKKEEIGTMMMKGIIKLGIVSEMIVREEDMMEKGRERGRLTRLEIVSMRKMMRKTEVATTAVKSNVTPGVVVRTIILSRKSRSLRKSTMFLEKFC